MKVEELIIDGFKSYATRTVISGWDASFNCITGLNGSGKSNILDAICFVLGITTMSTVRAQNLQDLIYKRGQAGVTKASVTIVFDNSDRAKSPIGFEDQTHISVTRQIVLGGTSRFLINGHRAQQQTVQQLFQSVQLNINNPNFLIMQGRITKVLNMKPAEILALIEEAAGTRMFEERRERALKTMSKKEKKVEEILALLNEEIEPKLENLRNEKRAFLEYQQHQSNQERLERVVGAHDYVRHTERLAAQQQELEAKRARVEDLGRGVEKAKREVTTLEEELASLKKKREAEMEKGGRFQALQKKLKENEQEMARVQASIEIKQTSMVEESEHKISIEKDIAALEKDVERSKGACGKLEDKYNKEKEAQDALAKQIAKNQELLQSLQTGVASKAGQKSGYANQLQEVQDTVNAAKTAVGQAEVRIQHLEKQIAKDTKKTAKAQADNKQTLEQLEALKAKSAELKQQLEAAGWEPSSLEKLKAREQELAQRARELGTNVDALSRRVANIDFQYTRPSSSFNPRSVKGLVAQLFNVSKKNDKAHTALEVCAGGRLFNVVVDTDANASQLLERGQLKRRVTIIPLNKIAAKRLSAERLAAAKSLAPGKVDLALNMIGYEADVVAAMEHVFGTTLICADKETANKITFDPNVRTKCVTLDGDVYDPQGTLYGGSGAKKDKDGLLTTLQKYNELQGALAETKADLEDVRYQLSKMDELASQFKDTKKAMELTDHEITIAEERLSNSPSASVLALFEQRTKEIAELRAEIEANSAKVSEGEAEMERIARDISEFNSNKGAKLDKLRAETEGLEAELKRRKAAVSKAQEAHLAALGECDQKASDLTALKEQLDDKLSTIASAESNLAEMQRQLEKAAAVLDNTRQALEAEQASLVGIDEELKSVQEALASRRTTISDRNLELQQLTHDVTKLAKDVDGQTEALKHLVKEYPWIEEQKAHFGKAGTPYDYNSVDMNQARASLKQMRDVVKGMQKTINAKVMNMIESVEKKETALKNMIRTIEKDKRKIEATIISLDDYKRKALVKTWEKVSEYVLFCFVLFCGYDLYFLWTPLINT